MRIAKRVLIGALVAMLGAPSAGWAAAAPDEFEALLGDGELFDGAVAPGELGEFVDPAGLPASVPAQASPVAGGLGAASSTEAWSLLHALSARVRAREFRALPPVRVRALELTLGPIVAAESGPLAGVAGDRWRSLVAAARSGRLADGVEREAALDGALDDTSLARALGEGALVPAARGAERAARLCEDRYAARLDGLVFAPLAVEELIAMLGSGEEGKVDAALRELRDRGPGTLFSKLLPRLGEVPQVAARVLDVAGRFGGEADRALLSKLGGSGGDSGADLDFELATPALPAGGAIALLARDAAARIDGRMGAAGWLAGGASRTARLFEESAAEHERGGDWRLAAGCWEMAAKLEPSKVGALHGRARALHRLGLFDGALESAERALAAGPADRRTAALAAGSLRALGRFDEVLPLLERELRSAEGGALKSSLCMQIAAEQLAAGRIREAAASLSLAAAGFVPHEQEARRAALRADVLAGTGEPARARALLERASADHPGSRILERRLAWIGARPERTFIAGVR